MAGILLCLTCLAGCDSCEKFDDLDGLPAETQTGANTFGCYVNGKVFATGNKAYASYTKSNKSLIVGGEISTGWISINIYSPRCGVKNILKSITYYPYNPKSFYSEDNVGELFLTRFDTINKIVSGTFFASVKLSLYTIGEKPDDTIAVITKGRFDIPLKIYDSVY